MRIVLILLVQPLFAQECKSNFSKGFKIGIGEDLTLQQCKHGMFLFHSQDSFVGKSLAKLGEWSELEYTFFSQFVQKGDIVIDGGANIGAFTIPLAKKVGKSGVVYAFEAQRVLSQLLSANVALNEMSNVMVHNIAIGAVDGKIQVPSVDYSAGGNFGGISLLEQYNGLEEEAMLMPLDRLYTIKKCISFIKLDLEGMELDALMGAKTILTKCTPTLYVENNCIHSSKDIIQYLDALGYIMYFDVQPYFNPENHFHSQDNPWGTNNHQAINMLALHPNRKNAYNVDLSSYIQINIRAEGWYLHQYKDATTRQFGDETSCVR